MKRCCRIFFAAAAALGLLSPLPAQGAARRVFSSGRAYIRATEAAAACGFRYVRNSGGTGFSDRGQQLSFAPDKRLMYYGGMKIYQSFAPLRRNGVLYISRNDFEKVLAPLSAKKGGIRRHRIYRITIDPGHGGNDRGASGRRSHEKDLTLKLSNRVAEILRACGYRVNLTRSRDNFVSLDGRASNQRAARSDLFVSIHANAAADRSLSGVETYALTPAGAPSTSGGSAVNTVFRGNTFDANNLFLACSIQRALLRRTRAVDRGVKRARFAVLKNISAPGVLVEVGFISNPREEQLLNDPAYREKVARGIAEGIISYHRGITR